MPTAPADLGPPAEPVVVPAPPSFGRQAAQLVIIPALIVLAAVGLLLLFGKIAGATDTIENQLERLRGAPLYKDRGLAAYNIATMIPTIKDPQKRRQLSTELIGILNEKADPEEDPLQRYLLTAIGRLGEEGGLDAILKRLDAPRPMLRMGAVIGLLSWPQVDQARVAVPQLIGRLEDQDPDVAAVAAAALGRLGRPTDPGLIPALQAALVGTGVNRERAWNAAVALACLGDPQGSAMVANVLLDRAALAKLSATDDGPGASQPMPPDTQDRVILSALAAAGSMTDAFVWAKISVLAEKDPNLAVQKAAKELCLERQTSAPRSALREPEGPGRTPETVPAESTAR